MLQRHLVYGAGRSGRVAVLLGRHHGAFQPEIVQHQAHIQVRNITVDGNLFGDSHIAQAGDRKPVLARRHVLDGVNAFDIGHRPLLRGFEDDGGKIHGLAACLIRNGSGYGVILGQQGHGKK